MSLDFSDFLCGTQCESQCEIKDKMTRLQQSLETLLCLTRSIYRDEHLREISSMDRFAEKFCQ